MILIDDYFSHNEPNFLAEIAKAEEELGHLDPGNYHDLPYLRLLEDILRNGIRKPNRTGIDTISVFGRMIEFDVSERVPVLTTKRLHLKSIIHELLWFLKGDTNIAYLKENGVSIWDEWADEDGDLGPVYGAQWRKWPTGKKVWISSSESEPEYLDQIVTVINELKTNPNSRRLMVNAWNAPVVWSGEMALPPCHYGFQLIVEGDRLSLMWNQRSVDCAVGLPFNIASYCILLYMIAQVTGYKPHRLIGSLGDVHIYENHVEGVAKQLSRTPYPSPSLSINALVKDIDDFTFADIEILDYVAHPSIKLDIAV